MLRERHREQRRKEWHRFLYRHTIVAERLFEFAEFLFRSLLGFKPPYPLEQIHQRRQRRVLVVLCIPTFPPYILAVRSNLKEFQTLW